MIVSYHPKEHLNIQEAKSLVIFQNDISFFRESIDPGLRCMVAKVFISF